MNRVIASALVATVAAIPACGAPSSNTPTDSGTQSTNDPRPIAERACPTGGLMHMQLWDVYATLRQPDGSVWDGFSSGTIELGCNAGADLVRGRLRDAINAQSGFAGSLADHYLGDQFQMAVADLCGLGANWIQMQYEGPDLFALGGYPGEADPRWRTLAVQDRWNAHLATTDAGAAAEWTAPCGSSNVQAILGILDEDVAFDDTVGGMRIDVSGTPPEVQCAGWGWLEGTDGIAGVLVRVTVDAGNQNCAGIAGAGLEDFLVPATAVRMPWNTRPPGATADPSATRISSPDDAVTHR